MVIQCESCQTRFQIDGSKIAPEGTSVRCSRCKHVFKVTREAEEEPAAPAPEEKSSAPATEANQGSSSFEFVMPGSEENANLADEVNLNDFAGSDDWQEPEAPEAANEGTEAPEPAVAAPESGDDPWQDEFADGDDAEPEPAEPSFDDAPQPQQEPQVVESVDDDLFADEFDTPQPTDPGVEPPASPPPQPQAQPEQAQPEEVSQQSVSLPKAVPLKKKRVRRSGSKVSTAPPAESEPEPPTAPPGVVSRVLGSSLVFNSLFIALFLIVLVVAFNFRGVQVWRPGQLYWLIKEGFASKDSGIVLLDYDAYQLDTEQGKRLFVIEGRVFNRSSEDQVVPRLRGLLTSNVESGLQQDQEFSCCLNLPLTKLRAIESRFELDALYAERSLEKPLPPDKSRSFMLIFFSESPPTYYKTQIIR